MNKTAIVIGATGLIGSHLVEQLISAVHINKVITLTRRPVSYNSNKVINYVVDFAQLEQHSSLFKADILFSCLGTTKKAAGSIDAQRKVDFNYQLHAAQLAAKNGVEHYLLVSSSGANANSRSAYLKMKGELDQAVTQLNFKQISIIQPSLLLGERDNDFRLGENLGSVFLPVLCMLPGLKKFRPITGKQVAIKMCNSSAQPAQGLKYYKLDELFQ
ncbi:NAD-dependent epimerase/dehydratase family protein [Pseudoalteromonas shioyasakiensis]|uniref:NAD-dependent epimerase/dehydratase family protein n=1 Tax=Pseudoalteromonas shioyasakiensis TaxID=1190813 RepID=UPI0021183EB4|nr:NAD-dependent epimerase/dehydratase family protein [Pseudoalteromonas shioyasakiensis]MCQ8877731.1 NAD-dependent epimerase/dehydratase family protein [Pseudoalteromonas shioyasakiensis]